MALVMGIKALVRRESRLLNRGGSPSLGVFRSLPKPDFLVSLLPLSNYFSFDVSFSSLCTADGQCAPRGRFRPLPWDFPDCRNGCWESRNLVTPLSCDRPHPQRHGDNIHYQRFVLILGLQHTKLPQQHSSKGHGGTQTLTT